MIPSSADYKVDPDTGCWMWQRSRSKAGYGNFKHAGVVQYAHRWFYEQANGPIPEGMTTHHVCRQRSCVNPAHVRLEDRSAHGAIHSTEAKRRHATPNFCSCGKRIQRRSAGCGSCSAKRRWARLKT